MQNIAYPLKILNQQKFKLNFNRGFLNYKAPFQNFELWQVSI
jgi:hypothetical protein